MVWYSMQVMAIQPTVRVFEAQTIKRSQTKHKMMKKTCHTTPKTGVTWCKVGSLFSQLRTPPDLKPGGVMVLVTLSEKQIVELKYRSKMVLSLTKICCSNLGDQKSLMLPLRWVASRTEIGKNKQEENITTNRQNTTGYGAKSRAPKGLPQWRWLKHAK